MVVEEVVVVVVVDGGGVLLLSLSLFFFFLSSSVCLCFDITLYQSNNSKQSQAMFYKQTYPKTPPLLRNCAST